MSVWRQEKKELEEYYQFQLAQAYWFHLDFQLLNSLIILASCFNIRLEFQSTLNQDEYAMYLVKDFSIHVSCNFTLILLEFQT